MHGESRIFVDYFSSTGGVPPLRFSTVSFGFEESAPSLLYVFSDQVALRYWPVLGTELYNIRAPLPRLVHGPRHHLSILPLSFLAFLSFSVKQAMQLRVNSTDSQLYFMPPMRCIIRPTHHTNKKPRKARGASTPPLLLCVSSSKPPTASISTLTA